jgi:MFS superfamily sulfate permease-like transporter
VLATIDAGQLFEVVWVSLLAGVGVTAAFSLVVLGGARSSEARRAGNSGAATAYAALAITMFALFAAGVVFGVHIMLSKS